MQTLSELLGNTRHRVVTGLLVALVLAAILLVVFDPLHTNKGANFSSSVPPTTLAAPTTTSVSAPTTTSSPNASTASLVDRVIGLNQASGYLPDDTDATRRTRLTQYCEPTFLAGRPNLGLGDSNADQALKGQTKTVDVPRELVNGDPNLDDGTARVTARVTVTTTHPDGVPTSVTYNRVSFWKLDNGVWLATSADGV